MPRSRALVVLILSVSTAACSGGSPSPDRGSQTPAFRAASPPAALPTSGPTLTPITPAPGTPAEAPTPSPTSRDRETPSPAMAARPAFATGAMLVTTTGDLRVRSRPRVSTDSTRYEPLLPAGTLLYVLKGPIAGSGLWWYRVRLVNGPTLRGGVDRGWVAAGDKRGKPWIGWLVDVGARDGAVPALPTPAGRVTGSYAERADPVAGQMNAAWALAVDNWADFRDDLFVPVASLRPCEGAQRATRTWLEITGADGLIVRRCDITSAQDLAGLWVPVVPGAEPPYPLHIRLWDRLTDRVAISEAIGRPGPTPAP